MKAETRTKGPFSVIGKEGSTCDGDGFIQKLWADANAHFPEVERLAKRNERGELAGLWGAMTNAARTFEPWEDEFSRGLYLAGVECADCAQAPSGWVKWTIPGYEYLCAECEHAQTFPEVIRYLRENSIPLAGAVHDYTCPQSGKNYMFFPIRRL